MHGITKKQLGEDVSNRQYVLSLYTILSSLCVKSFNDGNEKNTNKYILILSRLLYACIYNDDTDIRDKCVQYVYNNNAIHQLIVDYYKQLNRMTRSMVCIVRYMIYIYDKLSQQLLMDSMRILMDGCIHDDVGVRKESNRCISYMISDKYKSHSMFIQSIDASIKYNLDNWFIKPQRSLYTLNMLSSCLKYFNEEIITSYIDIIMRIIEGKSSMELKIISYITIENVYADKHMGVSYTRDLLTTLLSICEQSIMDMTNSNHITSMIQCIVQAYLNYNTSTPSVSKDTMCRILNVCSEVLCIESDDVSSLDDNSIRSIKERVTKNIELLLTLSVDEYLYPTDDTIDLLCMMTINDTSDNILDREGVQYDNMNMLTPRKRMLTTIKNMITSRYESSYVYVMNIIVTYTNRLYELGMMNIENVSMDMIDIMLYIKEQIGFNDLTEKCMGNIISKVNIDILFQNVKIRVLDFDMNSEEFDRESNAYILSLLSIYKTRMRFSVYFNHMWVQLHAIVEKIKSLNGNQEDGNKKLVYSRMKNIEMQYLIVLKKSTVINDECKNDIHTYVNSILDTILSFDDEHVDRLSFYGEPLKYMLVYVYNIRNSNPHIYSNILNIVKDKQLMMKMCKLNNKIEEGIPFVSDVIKLLILMLDKQVSSNIICKNIQRLTTYFQSQIDYQSKVFERNLRDIDTINTMISTLQDIDTLDVYKDIILLVDTLYNVEHEKIWKKCTNLCLSIMMNSHYSHCSFVFNKVSSFYDNRMKIIKNRKKQDMVEEKTKSKKMKQRLQSILLKVAKQFIKSYFMQRLEDDINGAALVAEEVYNFSDIYIPISIVCMKNKSVKTRNISREFIYILDDLYTRISGDNTILTSTILAGLAGKTSLMKSATVQMIGVMVEKNTDILDEDYKVKLVEIITMILKEKNRETFNAVITFLRLSVKYISEQSLKMILPTVLNAIYEFDNDNAKNSTKMITLLLERIVKKVGEKEVENIIPASEKSVLRYIRKQEKRNNKVRLRKREKEYEDRIKSKNNTDKLNMNDIDINSLNAISRSRNNKMNEETPVNKAEDLLLTFDTNVKVFNI